MTKKELAHWGRYVRWMANELGLRDWTIWLEVADEKNDCTATIEPIEGRKRATLTLKMTWSDLKADAQRHAITHELIHLHLISATDIIRNDVLKEMSQSAYDIMFNGFKRQIEYGVDGLADVIAPFLPLP